MSEGDGGAANEKHRVIFLHFTALFCALISLTTTVLLICWKFSVDCQGGAVSNSAII